MKNFVVLIALLFLFTKILYGQDENVITRYSTYEIAEKHKKETPENTEKFINNEKKIQEWIRNHPDYMTRGIITIPVVVHLLYYPDSMVYQNIPDWQIISQIDALNEDYQRMNADQYKTPPTFQPVAADCGIEFCLAHSDPNGQPTTGIVHKTTTWPIFNDYSSMKHDSTGGDDGWPYSDYLNIWVCSMAGGILGFSTLPVDSLTNEDGCVINYQAFGRINTSLKQYNLGRVTTHEVGHWFDLLNTWGNNSCVRYDSIPDIPNQFAPVYGCPAFPVTDQCSPNFPGVMYMNYMDNTFDSCMNIFTQGQQARMMATLNVLRSSILNSSGCEPVTTDSLDIGIDNISVPRLTVANNNITPVINLTNFGRTTVTTVTIYYARNYKSELHKFNWTGNLPAFNGIDVALPSIADSNGYQIFIAYTKNPNGKTDDDSTNDFKTSSYYVNTSLSGVRDISETGSTHNDFIVYPNPASNRVVLKFDFLQANKISDFEITNILGVSENFTWKIISSTEIELQLPDLPASLYFIRLKVNEKVMEQKMLIVSDKY